MSRDSRFPLRVTLKNAAICCAALDAYRRVDKKHLETNKRIQASIVETRTDFVRHGGSPICLLDCPETCILADAIAFLMDQDDATPDGELRVLDPERRRDAEQLVAALGDYNFTQFWAHVRRRTRRAPPTSTQPTPTQADEQCLKNKRDEIFREMVGRPDQVDIWGNVIETEHTDLRKHAKTTNFTAHPLQSSGVKLDDPDTAEKVKALNEKTLG